MRLIIAGGRDFDDYPLLESVLDHLLQNTPPDEITVISGTAKGADSLGERWADNNAIPIRYYPADWRTYGKRAGYVGNEQMTKTATHCVCFWDGKSKGTRHMIELAWKLDLSVRVIRYGEEV